MSFGEVGTDRPGDDGVPANQTEFEEKGFDRTVVVEFSSYQDAIDCYNSSEYKSALKLVEISALRLVSVVEGV